MTRHNIPLGRILGISIGLDYSWFVIFALLTWMLADNYYPAEFKDWPPLLYWFMGAVTAIMLFVSVLLHELGHSVVALRYKIPVRSITLFLFGGVAQIGAEPPSAIAEFLIASAGPLVSFARRLGRGGRRGVTLNISVLNEPIHAALRFQRHEDFKGMKIADCRCSMSRLAAISL